MESAENYNGQLSTMITSLIIGFIVVVIVYIVKVLRTNETEDNIPKKIKNEKTNSVPEKKKDQKSTSKKQKTDRWSNRDNKNFTHPWLLTNLKGHTGQIMDMDFSTNGKYLASCGDEDPDPGGESTTSSSSSSRSSREVESTPSQSAESSPKATKGLSRRQRKNRKREDTSTAQTQTTTVVMETKKKTRGKKTTTDGKQSKIPANSITQTVPLHQYSKLNMNEALFYCCLQKYLLRDQDRYNMGYPSDIGLQEGYITVFIADSFKSYHNNRTSSYKPFDVNAQEFIPSTLDCSSDSSQGSGSSSDSGENDSVDLEDTSSSCSEERDYKYYLQKSEGKIVYNSEAVERICVRCHRGFFVDCKEYLTQEKCTYHWGKHSRLHGEYTCCKGKIGSKGCSTNKLHVWNGLVSGSNGPLLNYVRTKPRRTFPQDGNYGVYAIDCEMCYTINGLELTKVTVIGMDGRLVYDSFVKPDSEIVDYNTRFSGITAKDLQRKNVKSLKEVQNDLMGFINAGSILIGHGLENDLRALRIIHNRVVDTSIAFLQYNGRNSPYKPSLKVLSDSILNRSIQNSSNGHNSYEDASAAMELMLWRVHKDFKQYLHQDQ